MSLRFKKILIFTLFSLSLFLFFQPVFASIDDDIAALKEQIANLESAIAPLKEETDDLSTKISSAKSQISGIEDQIEDLSQQLVEKEEDLEVQQELLAQRVRRYYKNSKNYNSFMIFFSDTSDDGSSVFEQYAWYQSIISQDKETITQYTTDINDLNQNKSDLEVEVDKLAELKSTLESRFDFLSGEIEEAETYKAELTQDLLNLEAQRIASLNLPTTVGSGIACVDDRNIDPGFGTGFAFFTFGIPHHVGLSQYGAYGRANAGQSYDQILRAYYDFDEYQDRSSITIKVNDGNGINEGSIIWTGTLEEYIKRIYEVPASWPLESLKAQAIAARSYALAVTNNGQNSICANQYCQVFKTDPKTEGQWQQAVSETSGKVMIDDGQVITAWYASTAGGYTITNSDAWGSSQKSWSKSIRDTSGDVNSLDDLKNSAYDKDSPCFYSAQGYRSEYNKSAWLKPAEVADIVNAILLSQKDSSVNSNLAPPDSTGWSMDKVKEELKNRGGTPCNSVSSVSVSFDFGSGQTSQITLTCDTGTHSFSGSTFKTYFNSRAPANIAIVGRLYNVETR